MTMEPIDPKFCNLRIRRVANGWVVHPDAVAWGLGPGYDQGDTSVARTPKELADMVTAWAQQQHDGIGQQEPQR